MLAAVVLAAGGCTARPPAAPQPSTTTFSAAAIDWPDLDPAGDQVVARYMATRSYLVRTRGIATSEVTTVRIRAELAERGVRPGEATLIAIRAQILRDQR